MGGTMKKATKAAQAKAAQVEQTNEAPVVEVGAVSMAAPAQPAPDSPLGRALGIKAEKAAPKKKGRREGDSGKCSLCGEGGHYRSTCPNVNPLDNPYAAPKTKAREVKRIGALSRESCTAALLESGTGPMARAALEARIVVLDTPAPVAPTA
jgi:hypothetical protein